MTMPENLFEYAAANKLRFPYKGSISVEDLYDLGLTELDTLYKKLRKEQKNNEEEESLLSSKSDGDVKIAVQIDIIKYIVNKKQAEIEARENAKSVKAKREKIMALMARKDDEKFENMTREELQKELDALK